MFGASLGIPPTTQGASQEPSGGSEVLEADCLLSHKPHAHMSTLSSEPPERPNEVCVFIINLIP